MALFTQAQISQITRAAEKSREALAPPQTSKKTASINAELNEMSENVLKYFKDSDAQLITTPEALHDYISKVIECGWCAIDTETTGLDRIRDTIVGWSIYYPGGVKVYIPCKHRVPIFEEPYKNQMSYEQCQVELQRLVDENVKVIMANADFDIAMIYKDLNVDLVDIVYYDVILAWRCLKENEPNNQLKILYAKYVKKGQIDGKRFTDFFTPQMFPYCKPEIAALYAANDAEITWELFKWQLPYVTASNPKCQKAHLEDIANLVWNVEMPMIKVCALLHRVGFHIDQDTVDMLGKKYHDKEAEETRKLQQILQDYMNGLDRIVVTNSPFKSGADFNPNSPVHVKYLLYRMMKVPFPESEGTGKEVLMQVNHPITKQILAVRGVSKLLNTYVDKLPKMIAKDGRIHGTFKSVGADTGRMASADPRRNIQACWGRKIKLTQGRAINLSLIA